MINDINVSVAYSTSNDWLVHICSGEWSTYREGYYSTPTKPTQRQLRQAVKQFKQGL